MRTPKDGKYIRVLACVALGSAALVFGVCAFLSPYVPPVTHHQSHSIMSAIVAGQTVGIDRQTFACHMVASPAPVYPTRNGRSNAPLGTLGR